MTKIIDANAQAFERRAQRDSKLAFEVALPAPGSDWELYKRWGLPQAWCATQLPGSGHQWSRYRDRATGALVFGFDTEEMAARFRALFG